MSDPVVAQVCADLLARSAVGIAKYGTTLAREDLTRAEWQRHLYEELLDAACYLRRQMSGEFPVGAPEGGNQSVASVPSRVVVPPAGPTPATCTPAARASAAGVAFSGEERA